jgi:hypothetical protein
LHFEVENRGLFHDLSPPFIVFNPLDNFMHMMMDEMLLMPHCALCKCLGLVLAGN